MKKYKVGFIGTGGRSVAYAKYYAQCDEIEIVALCDPDAGHRQVMAQKSGLTAGSYTEYSDFRDLLHEHDDLDGMVICSPNHLHAEHAIACFEAGLPVALEKPLSTTMGDCERILDAERINNGRSLLGFVLRSTPFYSKIYELISTGNIGRLVSIQADELPGLGVSSIMNRGFWRRNTAQSGGAMLEKCCHDMDLFNWLVNSRPRSLNSYGGNNIFLPNPLLPQHCPGCPVADDCQYYCKPVFSEHEDEGEEVMHQFIREHDACIFNIDKDIFDTQSVVIEYANGTIVNFMLNFNCTGDKAGRNFHAVGTRGRIWGNLHEATVFYHDNHSDKLVKFDCSGDGSGHGGGDRMHAMKLLRMMKEADYRPEHNAAAGYLSAAMCFASDISAVERTRINFRYGVDNKITLHL